MLQIISRNLLIVTVVAVASAVVPGVKSFDSASKMAFAQKSSTTMRNLCVSPPPSLQEHLSDETLVVDDRTKETEVGDGDHEETTLLLRGEISIASNPLPKTSDAKLVEFFQTPACRNLLLNGGGERPCNEVEVTQELLDDWRNRCVSLGARQPNEKDSILAVVSRGIQFPGLNVKSIATVGVKYVEDDDDDVNRPDDLELPTPRHEFVLLKNDSEASGLAPAVWIYNKLSGADSNKDNSNFKSLSTVSYEEKDDVVVFRTKAFLSIGITFPKFLLRILPGDKSTIEEKAGKSIQKTLDKDVAQSMQAYEKAYLSNLESSK
jgi:hypothetical protein